VRLRVRFSSSRVRASATLIESCASFNCEVTPSRSPTSASSADSCYCRRPLSDSGAALPPQASEAAVPGAPLLSAPAAPPSRSNAIGTPTVNTSIVLLVPIPPPLHSTAPLKFPDKDIRRQSSLQHIRHRRKVWRCLSA
jgi:hypothetical protein